MKSSPAARRKRRSEVVTRRRATRRRFISLLAVLVVVVAGGSYATGLLPESQETQGTGEPVQEISLLGEPRGGQGNLPEPPDALKLKTTAASAAYLSVAGELPGVEKEDIEAIYRSEDEPGWVAVRIDLEEEEGDYVLFLEKEGRIWEVRRSVLTDEPDYADNEQAVLGSVPDDLAQSLYDVPEAENGLPLGPVPPRADLNIENIPDLGDPQFSEPKPVLEDVPSEERARIENGLKEIKTEIEEYGGVAGVYVQDIEGGYGYGVRPDEEFFSASVIKVPVMVAVYRKIDEGELSLSDTFETKEEDWAAGAGWMQWEDPGESYSVYDYVWMMMTQSDNVATNALVRIVGGKEYVNEVARSMGAEDTVLIQKVTSERGAVPELDNRTTARDMAIMLESIASREAASPESCQGMIDVMVMNYLESWLVDGLPDDAEVDIANKGGWLYKVYDEVGIVFHEGRPYSIAILAKYGPGDPLEARPTLMEISNEAWQIQDDDGKEEEENEEDEENDT